jgi:uncharacterized Zn finger protein
MAKRGDVGPSGLELRVEVHWCPECGADCTVQIVQLKSDPQPVAMCAECGAGLALWLDPALVDPAHVEPRISRLGAA